VRPGAPDFPPAPGLLGCCLSGAGPSILVFFERGNEPVCDLVRQVFRLHGHESETLFCTIPEKGFELEKAAGNP
jgi:homoserine kinase